MCFTSCLTEEKWWHRMTKNHCICQITTPIDFNKLNLYSCEYLIYCQGAISILDMSHITILQRYLRLYPKLLTGTQDLKINLKNIKNYKDHLLWHPYNPIHQRAHKYSKNITQWRKILQKKNNQNLQLTSQKIINGVQMDFNIPDNISRPNLPTFPRQWLSVRKQKCMDHDAQSIRQRQKFKKMNKETKMNTIKKTKITECNF